MSVVGKDNEDWEPFKELLNQHFSSNQRGQNTNLVDTSGFANDFSSSTKKVLTEQLSVSILSQLSNMEQSLKIKASRTSNGTQVDNRPTAANDCLSASASINNSKRPEELARIVMEEKIRGQVMNDQIRTLVAKFDFKIVDHFDTRVFSGLGDESKNTVIQRICDVVKCFVRVLQKNVYSNTPFPEYNAKSKHNIDLKNIVESFMYEIMFEQENLITKTLIVNYLKEKCKERTLKLSQVISSKRKKDFVLTENKKIMEQFPEFLLINQNFANQRVVKMIQNLKECKNPSTKAKAIESVVDEIFLTVRNHPQINQEKAYRNLERGWEQLDVKIAMIAFCILESKNAHLVFDFEIMEMFIDDIDHREKIVHFKAALNHLIESKTEEVVNEEEIPETPIESVFTLGSEELQ